MTTKTRYFLMGSAGIMVVGLCTGLVAYYAGFPTIALQREGPPELQYCPSGSTVLAYANVQDVMQSDLRRRLKEIAPEAQTDGQESLKRETGIDIETDIDRVVACVTADQSDSGSGLVLASGRFDEVRLEGIARNHGATVEQYRGKRILVMGHQSHVVALAFMAPGLVGLGGSHLVKHAIDIQAGDAKDSVTTNEEVMKIVGDLSDGNAWAVGRFDALTAKAKLPAEVSKRLPPITWFAASAHVNGGISGRIRAEARDEKSANDLQEVLRGFMALARMQAGSNPQIQAMMESLQVGGSGKTVSLGFSVPAEVFDLINPKNLGGLQEPGKDIEKELEKAIEKALEHKDVPRH